MAWKSYHRDSDGRLLSVGTVHGPARVGVMVTDLPGPPKDDEMWNEATATFVPRPPKVIVKTQRDRSHRIAEIPRLKTWLATLPSTESNGVKQAIEDILGAARFD